jgi:hypothetical protein
MLLIIKHLILFTLRRGPFFGCTRGRGGPDPDPDATLTVESDAYLTAGRGRLAGVAMEPFRIEYARSGDHFAQSSYVAALQRRGFSLWRKRLSALAKTVKWVDDACTNS